ncbi:MAG: plasmid pRiA4b ORF-3 family protein [Planctomycetota bacterium]
MPEDRVAALSELVSYGGRSAFSEDRGLARRLYFGDRPPDERHDPRRPTADADSSVVRFSFFFLVDFRIGGGDTVIGQLLRRLAGSLSIGRRAYLEQLRDSYPCVFEILDVRADGGLTLGNLWVESDPVQVDADCWPVSPQLEPHDVVVARMLPGPDGRTMLEDDLTLFPARFRVCILDRLREDREALDADTTPADALRAVSFRFGRLSMEAEEERARDAADARSTAAEPMRPQTRYPYRHTHLPHLLDGDDLSARIPSEARNLALYLGRIVAGATFHGEPGRDFELTGVGCRRRPGRRRCGGEIVARSHERHDGLEWACPACQDAGTISSWRGSPFDLVRRPQVEEVDGTTTVRRSVEISPADHDRLLRLSHLTADAIRVLVRHYDDGEKVVLEGRRVEFAALVECIEHEFAAGIKSEAAASSLATLCAAFAAMGSPSDAAPPPADAVAARSGPHTRTGHEPEIDGGLVLHVELLDVEPPVWRRVEVPARALLEELHSVLIVAMGWTDAHLHAFRQGRRVFMAPDASDHAFEDPRSVRVGELLRQVDDELVWEYDFGDGWEHRVRVEEVRADAPERPRLLGGARACPPEDCGGAHGYAHLLEVLADVDHPEHAELLEWAGPVDPEAFDAKHVGHGVECSLEPSGKILRGPWDR